MSDSLQLHEQEYARRPCPSPTPGVKQQLCSAGVAEKSYLTSKVRSSDQKEIPHVEGKEQQLHFAGAAVKRYPTSEVRENQIRR